MRILVIDDDELVRESFRLALEKTGYDVDTAETGAKGVQMRKDAEYDMIFLDLKMPGMNGGETLKVLRDIDAKGKIYIITAFHKEFIDELSSAADDGLDFEVLKKPLDSNQIVLAAKNILTK